MSMEAAFLLIWVGFLILGLAAAFLALYWSIRNRQFSDQDRARYLPLTSGIPPEKDGMQEKAGKAGEEERPDGD